jgi:hypothetical protein
LLRSSRRRPRAVPPVLLRQPVRDNVEALVLPSYIARQRGNLISVGDLTKPLVAAAFEKTAGFLREQAGRTELLVPAERFQGDFPGYVEIMRELRSAGLARTERGMRPKLTIKAPSAICRTGRVYCIVIGTATV